MEMSFTFGDLYPAMTNFETGNLANPDAEDQEALNENPEIAKEADVKNSRPKYIWIAIALIALIVVFFGMD